MNEDKGIKIQNMSKTYWNGKGKYEKEVNKINKLMPDYGYTDNPYYYINKRRF